MGPRYTNFFAYSYRHLEENRSVQLGNKFKCHLWTGGYGDEEWNLQCRWSQCNWAWVHLQNDHCPIKMILNNMKVQKFNATFQLGLFLVHCDHQSPFW